MSLLYIVEPQGGGKMNPKNLLKQRLEQRLLEAIDQYRSIILDPVQQELGDTPNWKFLRSRLLKALGDRGLAGRIRETLSDEFEEKSKLGGL
jgi:hypothetical protein